VSVEDDLKTVRFVLSTSKSIFRTEGERALERIKTALAPNIEDDPTWQAGYSAHHEEHCSGAGHRYHE